MLIQILLYNINPMNPFINEHCNITRKINIELAPANEKLYLNICTSSTVSIGK
jgi:hypothetical protein